MNGDLGFTGPGTYVINTGGDKTTTIEADSLDYNGPGGSLRALKDGQVVASWRWWDSIIKKDD